MSWRHIGARASTTAMLTLPPLLVSLILAGSPYTDNAVPLQWRHNGRDGVSNHQPHDSLLNGLSKHRSKKTSKLRVTGLCGWNSPVTGEFPAQRASNAENDSIWWRHHTSRAVGIPYPHLPVLDWEERNYLRSGLFTEPFIHWKVTVMMMKFSSLAASWALNFKCNQNRKLRQYDITVHYRHYTAEKYGMKL